MSDFSRQLRTTATSSLATSGSGCLGMTVCPSSISSEQLVALRFEVRSCDSQKDNLWIGGSLPTRVGRVAEVLEDLGDFVGDVINPLVKALQRRAAKRFVEFAQAA